MAACSDLRQRVYDLEAELQKEVERVRTLSNAAQRAAIASAELLESRREQTELVNSLATARATVTRLQAAAAYMHLSTS